jgi:alkanesulfonate monooxygenase SsuD/methylene tetrahydromethanopterin reductase-like flavin-dependent oxidoreductase (luciferase family)
MRDTTRIVRGLLRGETVTYAGAAYSVDGVSLRGASAPDVPLLWGANGPRMVAAAAELTAEGVASGAMVNYLRTTGDVARIAAAVGGEVHAVVLVEVDDDEGAAVERMRSAVEGSPVLRRDLGVAEGEAVTFEAVAARMVAGPPARCRERLAEYLAAGATSVAVFADDVPALLDRLLEA